MANSLSQSLLQFSAYMGAKLKTIEAGLGTKEDLEELKSALAALINDEVASSTTVYSSNKVDDLLLTLENTVTDKILGGAGEAFDTLKELADLIETNQSAITALETLAAGHVKYDEAQELTEAQQAQARTNIGAASTTSVEAVATDLASLTTNVGDTEVDLVAAFDAAYKDDSE